MSLQRQQSILTLSCPDRIGIVAAVSGFLADRGALITEAQHYREPISNSTVLRLAFEHDADAPFTRGELERAFEAMAAQFGMNWEIHDARRRSKILVAVSKPGHCLKSLLHRWQAGTLPVDIAGVVSNHETQRRVAQWYDVPYYYLPIGAGGKEEQERELLALFAELNADFLVLARYMQVLTGRACRELAGRAINIHHSFLPGFKGAKPYHQAFVGGVKLIGATAHYVNENLDEGPIIEQAVERVDHTMNVEQFTALGNEIESVVLNRAVQWRAEHRVFAFGNRTVVLR